MAKKYLMINDFSLRQYNSMRLPAYAESAYIPYDVSGLDEMFTNNYLEESIILGNGSNVIFSKEKCETPVVVTNFLNNIKFEGECIIADCGVSLSQLAWYALEHSVAGFEYLEDIPGFVGGGLYMNAGTYDDCIENLVQSVTIYDYKEKQTRVLMREELMPFWNRRDSYFQHYPCFIIQSTFFANRLGVYERILSKMLELKEKRYLKQPRNYPSAGSAFKRPYINGEPKYIWQLFDLAGLRGFRIGDAQVSEKHPGFIVNRGNATGKEVIELMNYCKMKVWERFRIQIEEEWRIL